jgi:hypothetical protein
MKVVIFLKFITLQFHILEINKKPIAAKPENQNPADKE